MPTPYPSPRPGSRPPKNLIRVPAVIEAVLEQAGRDLAVEAYYQGHDDGWERSSRQYLEAELPDVVEYILTVQGRLTEEKIRTIREQVESLLTDDC